MSNFNNSNSSNNRATVSWREMAITAETRAQLPSPAMEACPPCSSSTLKMVLQGLSYQGRPLHVLQRTSSYDPLLPLLLALPLNLSPHRYSHLDPLVPGLLLHGTHMPRWLGPLDRQLLVQIHVAEYLWNLVNPPPP